MGALCSSTGTLYGALRRLLDDDWIEYFKEQDTSRGRQAYRLTARGRKNLQFEASRLKHLSRLAKWARRGEGVMMLRLYRYLLYLYPGVHRTRFGDEMIEVFRDLQGETMIRSKIARAAFYFRETAGLLAGALQEHWRALSGTDVWLPFPLRRLTVRNQFRFPKATAVLMTIILAGVVMAIEKGEGIVASLTNVNPALGPVESPHFDFVPRS